jgi:hypothetical protein
MHVPDTADRRSIRLALLACAAALVLIGCRNEEPRTYSAPTEASSATPSRVSAAAPALQWTTPAGWEEQPASGMRVGSFIVKRNSQEADVSIIPLGGASGGELSNVNRWRGQIGLGPVDEEELRASAEPITVGQKSGSLYEMSGTDPQTQQEAGVLGAIVPDNGTTWFFKMSGPEVLVAQQKPAFKQWLSSMRFGPAQQVDPVAEAHRFIGPDDAAGFQAPSAVAEDKPVWQIPEGWQEQPASSMRVGSFLVSEGTTEADVSVIKLSGLAGGVLANVNRWRSQLGLGPVEEEELEKMVVTKEIDGAKALFVEMTGRSFETGEPSGMLVAMVPQSGSTWFYKMAGDAKLVAREKDAFMKFVETARYPNAP